MVFGFELKRRSFSNGEGEGGRDRNREAGVNWMR